MRTWSFVKPVKINFFTGFFFDFLCDSLACLIEYRGPAVAHNTHRYGPFVGPPDGEYPYHS